MKRILIWCIPSAAFLFCIAVIIGSFQPKINPATPAFIVEPPIVFETEHDYDEPHPANPIEPEPEMELRLVLVGQLTDRETTMYTKYDDGGDWDRKTSSNNFDGDYPDKFKSLTWANENRGAICAVPWRYRKFKEDLIKLPDGTTIQRYALNFPWVDAPDVRRIPCDRVPYRDKWGNLVPQRERFDMYVHMPKKQAFKWGHPVAPILVYEWKLVEVGNE